MRLLFDDNEIKMTRKTDETEGKSSRVHRVGYKVIFIPNFDMKGTYIYI